MAIDNIPYADSDSFAHPDKSFYPLKIPVSHWQLRHYISHPEKDVLYYASGSDVYYLNTATRKRKHIANLPFEARCTASGYGYVCVGGEEGGHFAVIKLEGRTADVDAPLPLDYWHTHQSTPHASNVKVQRIGEEIVNSISIHRIQDQEAHLYDVVAVLTNNDKTVRIYSLSQGIETSVLDLPFPMNHATISPDGKTMVAVGDINKAFFYSRELLRTPPQIPKPHNRLTMCSVGWKPVAQLELHIPDRTAQDNTVHPGYFSTAWSPSGHLLAVGSEAGYITVFDMLLFAELGPEDIDYSILACIPSSRPNIHVHMHPGAVRSMLFTPEPWDLLIWAEDQGRICVGDLRTGLKIKQVIHLDPKEDDLKKLDIVDVLGHDDSMGSTRLLELEDDFLERHGASFGNDYVESQLRARARRHNRIGSRHSTSGLSSSFQDDPHGLTAHEQEILESLRTTRQRQEAIAQGNIPRSVNYTTPDLFHNQRHDRSGPLPREGASWFSDNMGRGSDYDAFPELARTNHRTPPPPDLARSRDEIDPVDPNRGLPDYRTWRDLQARGQLINQDESATLPELQAPPLHAIQQYLMLRDRRSQQTDEATTSSQLASEIERWQPRRRASVVLSPSTSTTSRRPIPPHALRANDPSSIPATEEDGPWRTISNAMNLARGPLFEASSTEDRERDRERLRMLGRQRDRPREAQSRAEPGSSTNPAGVTDYSRQAFQSRYELLRDTTSAVQGLQSSYDILQRRQTQARGAMLSTATGREIGVRTAGLAIARDGSTVWAATEEGIFEIKLELKSRMRWPAMDLR